jgi:hypothetical protein
VGVKPKNRKGTNKMETETFVRGDVVWSLYTAKRYVVGNVSITGRLAFGDGPFRSSDYEHPWRYTKDEAAAVRLALVKLKDEHRDTLQGIVNLQQRADQLHRAIVELGQRQTTLGGAS